MPLYVCTVLIFTFSVAACQYCYSIIHSLQCISEVTGRQREALALAVVSTTRSHSGLTRRVARYVAPGVEVGQRVLRALGPCQQVDGRK